MEESKRSMKLCAKRDEMKDNLKEVKKAVRHSAYLKQIGVIHATTCAAGRNSAVLKLNRIFAGINRLNGGVK